MFRGSCQKVAKNVVEELLLKVVIRRVGNFAIQQIEQLFNAGTSRQVQIMVAHEKRVVQQKGIKSRIDAAKIFDLTAARIMFVSPGNFDTHPHPQTT